MKYVSTRGTAPVLEFGDVLLAGLAIAATPNVGGTCTGGTVTATAGGSTIVVASRQVAAGTATPTTCS